MCLRQRSHKSVDRHLARSAGGPPGPTKKGPSVPTGPNIFWPAGNFPRAESPAIERDEDFHAARRSRFGQITCVNINKTTSTSGTPSNQSMIGISASRLLIRQHRLLNNACVVAKFPTEKVKARRCASAQPSHQVKYFPSMKIGANADLSPPRYEAAPGWRRFSPGRAPSVTFLDLARVIGAQRAVTPA
jgi:hypothetical protein